MKSQADITQKLKQVQFRHAKREIESRLAIVSSNCTHNILLDTGKVGKIGTCGAEGCPRYRSPCDDRIERVASSCGFFEPLHTPEDARVQVKTFFKEAPPSEIAAKYADVAALLWVLDGARPEPTDPCHAGTVGDLPIWADTPEAATEIRAKLEDNARELVALRVERAFDQKQKTAKPLYRQETLDSLSDNIKSIQVSLTTINDDVHRLVVAANANRVAAAKVRPFLLAVGLALGALFWGIWKKP